MSKLKKCLYLINLLERRGPLTLKEINDIYQYSSLYEGEDFQPRTFLRYKDFIEETFPCYIEYNARTSKYELHRHKALYGEDDSLNRNQIKTFCQELLHQISTEVYPIAQADGN